MYVNTRVLVNFTCGKQGCEFSCLQALGVGNTQPAVSTTQDKKGFWAKLSGFLQRFHWSMLVAKSISGFFTLDAATSQLGWIPAQGTKYPIY
jgi:hypothetical protein